MERRELPRDVSVTAAADTIADREWRRCLHPVPDDMLLAPGTDDLETGHGSPRVLPSFRHCRSLLSHRCAPSLMATAAAFVSMSDAPTTFGVSVRVRTSSSLRGGVIGPERETGMLDVLRNPMGNTIREVASYCKDVTIKPLDCRDIAED